MPDRGDLSRLDIGFPHPARVYDALLDGKDNFAADRAAAEAEIAAFPGIIQCAGANRAFLERTVRYLAAEAGIRQFLDIGTGLPMANNTHEVAQSVAGHSSVAYVDNDPIVLLHARALLTSEGPGKTDYIDADLRDPGMILREAARLLDFSEPVAVILIGIMHFIPDEDRPYKIVATLLDAVAPGSYLAMSHQASDLYPEESAELAHAWNEQARETERLTLRGHPEVARFFDDLDLVAPGVVQICKWRPRTELEADAIAAMWGAVARKPLPCSNSTLIADCTGASLVKYPQSRGVYGGRHDNADWAGESPARGAESAFAGCPARGRNGPRAQRSRTLAVHTLRSQRPFAPGLQFLLASRSLVAALPVH